MKILKCPKCDERLESVERFTHCVEYADVSITDDGKEVETNIYNDAYNSSGYRCSECSHEDKLESFIVDGEPCDHALTDDNTYKEYGKELELYYSYCTKCHCIIDKGC